MKKFTSPISTNKEQSERLIALGVKPETADMVYHYTKSKVPALEWELKNNSTNIERQILDTSKNSKVRIAFS